MLRLVSPMKPLLLVAALVFAASTASAIVGGNGNLPVPPTVPPTVGKPGCNKQGGSSKPSNKPAEKPSSKPAPKKSAPARK